MSQISGAFLCCLAFSALNWNALDSVAPTPGPTGREKVVTEEAGAAAGSSVSGDATTRNALAKDIEELRHRILDEEEQMEQFRKSLAVQREMLQTTLKALAALSIPVRPDNVRLVNAAAGTPAIATASQANQQSSSMFEAPLSLRIGNAFVTPGGFVDFSFIARSTNLGSGLATNFGEIPFNNTPAGHLTDMLLSAQSTRPTLRLDSMYKDIKLLGYFENDFLGNQPTNILVTANGATFRLRLAFADLQRNRWEITGGQTWTLLTSNRTGISPLPDDVFYGKTMDPNTTIGISWARQAGIRVAYHASPRLHFAIALENPLQYIGGAEGAGTAVLPSNLPFSVASEVSSGASSYATPAVRPDILGKIAFDLGSFLHSEVVGVTSEAKIYNSATGNSFSTTGGGIGFNNNIGLGKGVRLFENALYGRGIGRYLAGQGPDVVINSNGRPTNVEAASGLLGAEAQLTRRTLLTGYYGIDYFGRAIVWDPASMKYVGYGYAGSANSQNRFVQELTLGVRQAFWEDLHYGSLSFAVQYSYLFRSPWWAAAAPTRATENMLYLNMRYTLPGPPKQSQRHCQVEAKSVGLTEMSGGVD
jgi:hypothetical protein